MGVLLSNALILEGKDLEPVEGGLRIKEGKIERIVRGAVRRGADLKRSIIMPPLVNAHTHLMDAVAKERYLGRKLEEVVGPDGEKFRAIRTASGAQKKNAVRETMKDMLSTGTLACCDFREEGAEGVKLLREISGDVPKPIILGRPIENENLNAVLEVSDGIGLPSIDEYHVSTLKRISREVRRRKKIFAMHVAEDREYEDGEIRKILRLKPNFLVHGTRLTGEQLALLAESRTPLVFCPRSNHILGAGEPPLWNAMEAGARFFLGTDNAMVCQPDMFGELSFAWAHLRSANQSCGSSEALELLKSATVDAAEFFNLPWGAIGEGENATFIVLARKNNLREIGDVRAGLVNRARADNIRAIYVNGHKIAPI